MNMQQAVQPKSSSNGYDHRRAERDPTSKFDNKLRTGKVNSSKSTFGVEGRLESPSRDRVVYMTTCLIGHQVEVQVVDGSIFSGVFHATDTEDFGIVLKMARLIKDGSWGQKNASDYSHKHPATTLIIPSKDFVQVTAKGLPVTKGGLANELQHEKLQELLTDSCISQSRQVDLGRELEPWVPDEDDPGCPELENIFDSPWQRGWDQFETNATLFGVKSTFKEELYTTKLERGPRMREIEREASRIAREIEGEETLDLHLAEERGIQFDGYLDLDEETRFSSVHRRFDDSGYEEIEDRDLDSWNSETFGGVSSSSLDKALVNMNAGQIGPGTHMSSKSSLMEEQSSLTSTSTDLHYSHSEDDGVTERIPKPAFVINDSRANNTQIMEYPESSYSKEDKEKQQEIDKSRLSHDEDPHALQRSKEEISDTTVLSPNATAFDPSHPSSGDLEKSSSSNEPLESAVLPNAQGTNISHARPSSSASSTSDYVGAASTSAGQGLSSSSSRGSLTSEKSTLNPYAKEFKLNPNAKSFVPSTPPLRPSSPIPETPFYYPPNMSAVTQMHGMPVGFGVPSSFVAQQPVMFNPQGPPMPQPYYHRNTPQYGQQIMVGQATRPLYMPTYPSEMPYQGREF